jgi:hypothetical protein
MNELKDIIDKLYERFATSGLHWEVVRAEKLKDVWELQVRQVEIPAEPEGENESN